MQTLISHWLFIIPALPLSGAFILGLFGNRLPKQWVAIFANSTVFASFFLGLAMVMHLPENQAILNNVYTWIAVGGFRVDIVFRLDALSSTMLLVVTGISSLIHLYSIGYMANDSGFKRFFTYLNLFVGNMLILILADSLPLMFVGWEGVGLCSYLLIGFYYTDIDKARCGLKAFIVNRIGDFGFIVGMLLLFYVVGDLSFSSLKLAAPELTATHGIVLTVACLMLFLGATGKSAQIPLYVWLPDAMAGPTPVSALIHAATMVTAGVYMIARLHFLYLGAPIAMATVAIVGAATALLAATIGLTQVDIKKVLAYSTVSQLGYMFMAVGVGAFGAGVFHLVTHAFFKACLFLGAGAIIHALHEEQDIRHMGGLWKKLPIIFGTFLAASMALSGIIGTAGFASKDEILFSAFISGHSHTVFSTLSYIIWSVGALTALLTAIYTGRLFFLVFFSGPTRLQHETSIHRPPWTMWIPLVILGFGSLFAGVLNWPHILGGHSMLTHFLGDTVGGVHIVDQSLHNTEIYLMIISIFIAFIGFGIAAWLYAKKQHSITITFATSRPWNVIHNLFHHKWYIDELYHTIIINPLWKTADIICHKIIDKTLIDGSINALGLISKGSGYILQLFQRGNIQQYLAIFAAGIAVVLYTMLR